MRQRTERLDEYDQHEWRDIARRLRPEWTDQQFEAEWVRFCNIKDRKREH